MAQQASNELVGQTMINVRGEKIGRIDSLWRLGDAEEARWACVKYGPLHLRCAYVPLHDAMAEDGQIRVPYETEHIRAMPDVDVEEDRIPVSAGERLHRHFGLEPLDNASEEIDDELLELPREPREAVPPALEEGPDSPLAQRRHERARELGVPQHDGP